MHVTGMTTHVVRVVEGTNWVLLHLTTDAGVDGWGECTLEGKDASVLAAAGELFRSLAGQDVTRIELLWNGWLRNSAWKGAALYSAMSGLEQALWDIRGKALGLPVHALLGGAVRDAVDVYTWLDPFPEQAAVRDQVDAVTETYGYRTFKIDPFDGYFSTADAGLPAALERTARLVEVLGADGRVAIEAHQRFLPGAAVQAAKAFAQFSPVFLEEPVLAEDLAGLAHVRAATDVPLAWGERCFTRWGATEVLSRRLVDYLQIDLCHVGGILEGRKVAAMAEAHGVSVVPHNPNGPLGWAATLQLAALSPNLVAMETVHQRFPVLNALLAEPFVIEDGRVQIPAGPGLGVTIDEDAVAAHAGQPSEFAMPAGAVIPRRF